MHNILNACLDANKRLYLYFKRGTRKKREMNIPRKGVRFSCISNFSEAAEVPPKDFVYLNHINVQALKEVQSRVFIH